MSASDESDVALTLVIPLRAKATMSLPDFYEYWLNAHVTLPARFPGISSIWLHVVSFDGQLWPRLPGVSHRPEAEDEFHGVPEATFPTMADLELFQSYAHVQMVDGINFLGEVITYSSVGSNSTTVVDKLDDAAPDGHDNLVRPPMREGGPELIVGGHDAAAFRRAARLGDGWIMGGGTPEMFSQLAGAVDQAWQ